MADNEFRITATAGLRAAGATADIFTLSISKTAQKYANGGHNRLELAPGASAISLPFLGVTSAAFISLTPVAVSGLQSGIVYRMDGSGSVLSIKDDGAQILTFGKLKPGSMEISNPNFTDPVAVDYIVTDEA